MKKLTKVVKEVVILYVLSFVELLGWLVGYIVFGLKVTWDLIKIVWYYLLYSREIQFIIAIVLVLVLVSGTMATYLLKA